MTTPRQTLTAAHRKAKLEADLEGKFYRMVKGILRGEIVKIAPTETGIPDRLVVLPGARFHLVELKTETGVVSPKQKFVHAKYARLGVHVWVLEGEQAMLDWVADRQRLNN